MAKHRRTLVSKSQQQYQAQIYVHKEKSDSGEDSRESNIIAHIYTLHTYAVCASDVETSGNIERRCQCKKTHSIKAH